MIALLVAGGPMWAALAALTQPTEPMATGKQVLRAYSKAFKKLDADPRMTATSVSAGMIFAPGQKRGHPLRRHPVEARTEIRRFARTAMTWLKELFAFLGGLLGLVSKEVELRNTPEMQAAAKAKDQVANNSKAEVVVQNKDEKATRNLLAE
jgi:hypothetical protein